MNKTFFSGSVTVCGQQIKYVGSTEWEDFDEALSNNGGSYFQPTHVVSWSDLDGSFTLTIEDTSCGDFGARVCATLTKDGERVCSANYGSLSGEEYTDFDYSAFDCSVAIAIAESLDYHIPSSGIVMEEIKKAIQALGLRAGTVVSVGPMQSGRATVSINGQPFGVWDAIKKTFVD